MAFALQGTSQRYGLAIGRESGFFLSTTTEKKWFPFKGGRQLTAFWWTLGILLLLLGALYVGSGVYTEIKWYSQLGVARVFWIQWGWAFALGVIGALLVAICFWFNFRYARSKDYGSPASVESYRNFVERFRWTRNVFVPGLVGLIMGVGLSSDWQTYLTWFYRTPFGDKDPQFGMDISFYIFTYPLLQSLWTFAVTLLVVSAIGAVLGHYIYGGVILDKGKVKLQKRAKIHVAVLGLLAFAIVAAYFWLERYQLLLNTNSRFSGASYTDINANLPGLTILAITFLIIAVIFVYSMVKNSWRLVTAGVIVAIIAGITLGWAWPTIVQQFRVTPNTIELESPFINRNIEATKKAYGLNKVETISYNARTEAQAGQLRDDAKSTAQIRLLDPSIVSPTFNQMQQNRQYYGFAQQLSVDRYNLDNTDRDTVIAVRELNLNGLGDNQRSWVNDHTVYTHGFGVVAAYGNTTGTSGAPEFLQSGIPSQGRLGEYEPRVYFGQNSPDYSIVGAPKGSEPWEIDYPSDKAEGSQVLNTYQGNGGPKIGNFFDKLMFAIRFSSTDIFFSNRVTKDSQILFNRDPHDRVARVAPYLTLDSKAYPAVVDMDGDKKTPKRLVWIIDGYTTSENYPYSARESLARATNDALTDKEVKERRAGKEVNYIRNSVKAVVDAYDGSVNLYAWDDKDPILRAWDKIFPNVLKPVNKMSGDLMAHIRYPEDMFKIQRTLMARYHVSDPGSFYTAGDFWNVPNEPAVDSASTKRLEAGTSSELQPPYYLTLQMPGQESAEFSLSTGYIPGGRTDRNIMTGFMAVDSNAGNEAGKVRDGYGKIRLLELPRDLTVPGPGQAQNNFLSNQEVSRRLNLLRQGGTTVRMGNLLTLPVGGGMLYVQPVYVQASQGTTYPLMQYVLTAFGDGNIGFAPTLEEALNQTFGGDSGAKAGDANIESLKKDVSHDKAQADESDGKTDKAKPKSDDNKASAPAEASAPTPAAPAAPAGGAQERLNNALSTMRAAVTDADKARQSGDWAAYGEAEKRIRSALDQAVAAQKELEGNK